MRRLIDTGRRKAKRKLFIKQTFTTTVLQIFASGLANITAYLLPIRFKQVLPDFLHGVFEQAEAIAVLVAERAGFNLHMFIHINREKTTFAGVDKICIYIRMPH